jgi:hypothetical protein
MARAAMISQKMMTAENQCLNPRTSAANLSYSNITPEQRVSREFAQMLANEISSAQNSGLRHYNIARLCCDRSSSASRSASLFPAVTEVFHICEHRRKSAAKWHFWISLKKRFVSRRWTRIDAD